MVSPEHVSVVIPTLSTPVKTVESVPDAVGEVAIVTEGSRSEARNIGAERTTNPILVFLDDDIGFTERFFREQVNETDPGTVRGLRDYTFDLLLTRFLVVHRTDFERIGGFDESFNHMEDTEFSIRALANGLDLQRIPREEVTHFEHEPRGKGLVPTLYATGRIMRAYPEFAPYLTRRYVDRLTELGLRESYAQVSKR